MGSITRFMRPLIVSLFWARLATRIARPAKLALPVRLTTTSASHDPVMRTSNASRAKIRITPSSTGITATRAIACA